MGIYRATATFEHDSGLPEDRVVNSFHFGTATIDGSDTPSTADLEELSERLRRFYGTSHSNGGGFMGPLGELLSAELTGSMTVRVYDAEGAPPHYPIFEEAHSITLGTTGNGALPSEVALVGSFQAPKVNGQAQERRRGRVYIGPLVTGASSLVAGRARPNQNTRDRLLAAMIDLRTWSDTEGRWSWRVYSKGARQRVLNADGKYRATGPLLAPTSAVVAECWVDDAFDTQRRRGAAPTLKQSTVTGLVLAS